MRNLFLLFLMVFSVELALAQDLESIESKLTKLGNQSITLRTEEERLAAADTMALILDTIIGREGTYNYPFEKVRNLSKLHAPQKAFRIYTWSVPLRAGYFAYYGRIVLKTKEGFRVINLADNGVNIEKPEFQLLSATDWYGAVYYDIIEVDHKRKTYYTLLGYRPDNSVHHEKVLEVLDVDNMEVFRWGARVFNTPILNGIKYDRPPYRLIFRYSPRAVFGLRWMEKEKHILFDHLAPPDASMMEDWKMYGPDFSYDKLFWDDGLWQLEESIEIKGSTRPSQSTPVQQGLPEK